MSRFIAVIHGWHVSSNGFNVHELDALNAQQADMMAAALCMHRQDTFDNCAYRVIEIGPKETIKRRRKLTLRERLTGWVQP